jgi:hypothetical protein
MGSKRHHDSGGMEKQKPEQEYCPQQKRPPSVYFLSQEHAFFEGDGQHALRQ